MTNIDIKIVLEIFFLKLSNKNMSFKEKIILLFQQSLNYYKSRLLKNKLCNSNFRYEQQDFCYTCAYSKIIKISYKLYTKDLSWDFNI